MSIDLSADVSTGMSPQAREWYLLGLPGPTQTHAGLAAGNLASQSNRDAVAHPRAAALQVLSLARRLIALGQPVACLPPLARPDQDFVKACGLTDYATTDPDAAHLWRLAGSSAFMWAANAGTFFPAADRGTDTALLVPANLLATPHRALETLGRCQQLRAYLDPDFVQVDNPLPTTTDLADEGAANHHRIVCQGKSLHLFVHGRVAPGRIDSPSQVRPRLPARQTRMVGQILGRRAGVDVLDIQQSPEAIDAGAFHNDVVMVGQDDLILVHASAWQNQDAIITELHQRLPGLRVVVIPEADLSLTEAVGSYLFNGVLIPPGPGRAPWFLVPQQCQQPAPRAVLDRLVKEEVITGWDGIPLDESMKGGGGPACLRLRLIVPDRAIHPGLVYTPQRLADAESVVNEHWPSQMTVPELSDPTLPERDRRARLALANALGFPLV